MSLTSYPKIYNLGHAELEELFSDHVIVQEKVDGSQFSFGIIKGKFHCRSKGKDQSPPLTDKMFERAVEVVKDLPLHDGWVYRGEYLEKPKHNILAYARVPTNHVVLFDITIGVEKYLPYDQVFKESTRLKLETVPLLTSGVIGDWESLEQLLDTESFLGGSKIEGMVIKNYSRFGRDGKALMGKFVSEAFKESHSKAWKERNPNSGDVVHNLITMYATEARWEKAIQHLRDSNVLEHSPRDIGPLLKEIQTDVLEEEEEAIREALFKWAWPKISRGLTNGFPEFYKKRLASEQTFSKGVD
jgi:hypothetical protein